MEVRKGEQECSFNLGRLSGKVARFCGNNLDLALLEINKIISADPTASKAQVYFEISHSKSRSKNGYRGR